MPDMSQMSTEDLLRIYQGNQGTPASPGGDMASKSTEDLLRIYQGTTPTAEPQGPPDLRPWYDRLGSKLSSFAQRVYENPPPTVAGIRDIIQASPQAAQELTWGADPEAAREAAGTMLGAAMLATPTAPGLRAGEGVLGAPRGIPAARPPVIVPPSTPTQEAIEAAGRLDVGIPRYLATETTGVPQIAAALKNVPVGGEPIVRSSQKLLEDLAAIKGEIAGGGTTPELAGTQAREGLAGWAKVGSKEPVSEAYRAIDQLVNPDVTVPLRNTAQEVVNIINERANARIPGSSKAADQVLTAISPPRQTETATIGQRPAATMPPYRLPRTEEELARVGTQMQATTQPQIGEMGYEGLKRLRSFVGERSPQELVAQGINAIENKRIYAALTQDLQNVIREAGGDAALAKWQEANALARLTNMRRQLLNKIIGTAGDAAPEAVFSRLQNYAGSKSSADIRRLQLAKSAMGPEAWNEVGQAMINRMGMAPDGKFSADRFVTAFGNLAPAARNQLFEGQQLAALNDLFTVSKHIQDRITRFGNPSGTGRTIFGGGLIAALLHEPISTIGTVAGTRFAAHLLSQPAVARATADVARATSRGDPAAERAALDRLAAIVARLAPPVAASRLAPQNPRQELQPRPLP
jgi:hypothetical protein